MPAIKNLDGRKLTSIRLQEGVGFKQDGDKPMLDEPPPQLLRRRITLNHGCSWCSQMAHLPAARA
ncbi:MAG TPA: hypothetical protein VF278_15725 [Pirellulales bacterium]